MSYYHIIRLIELGKIDALDTINDLTPIYQGNKLDPINVAIHENRDDLVPYLVEERLLQSESALKTALDLGHLETAIYLYDLNFLYPDGNYVSSLEVMKLTNSWGCMFDSNAFFEILTDKKDNKVSRLQYYLTISQTSIDSLAYYELYMITDELASLLIYYTNSNLLEKVCQLAIKKKWVLTICCLLDLNVSFDIDHFQRIASSDNHEYVDYIRKRLNVGDDDFYPYVFISFDTINKNIFHYLSKVDNVPEFAVRYNLMDYVCEFGKHDLVLFLLDHGVNITLEHLRKLLASSLITYQQNLKILQRFPPDLVKSIYNLL